MIRAATARDVSAHIAFVTEGGPTVGFGHVSRCIALARALLAEGARTTFVVTPEPRMTAWLAALHVDVVPASWPNDPDAALGALRSVGPDMAVADSYKATPDFLRML